MQVLGDEWRTVAAAGLLAVQHFNSRDPSIVPELANISSCNVSFHTEVFDTGSEETRTVQQFLRQYTDSDVSQFDVIVGPARSACSAPVALIAGIEKIPQISYWATSPTLEDRQKYPYFLRTISSDSESTVSAAQLFHFLGYRSVALLYVDDEYGKGYAPAFDSAAAGLGISATPAKFDFHDHDSIDAALAAIAASGLRVFLVAILEDDAMYTLRKAVELGIVGPGFLWIFTDSLRNSFFSEIRDTVLINALSGGGRMGASGANYGSAGYEKMVHHVWPAEDNNLEYYRKHFNPFNLTTNFFSENPPTDLEFYAFDATIAMGLAACAAAMSKSGSLTGEHIHANLVNSSFSGVSGKVQFDRATGNRNRANTNIYLSNFVSNGTVLRVDEVAGRWNPIRGWSWSAPFVYSDGATPPPFPCDPGYYYANELGCDKCPVGTAEASAGVRDSCTKCKKGTFAPNAASLSCGSCPNGQIALTYGSDTCVPCPAGATCTDTSSLTVDAGMWRASWGEPFDVYECPIGPDACPGGIGFGETLCAEGYVGPLCSRCDRHFFLSWFVCSATRVRHRQCVRGCRG